MKNYSELPSTARHVNFRMPPEVINHLVALGIVPAEFDRKILSNAILAYFKEFAEKQPRIEPGETTSIVQTLKSIEERLAQLEGKFPPQIA